MRFSTANMTKSCDNKIIILQSDCACDLRAFLCRPSVKRFTLKSLGGRVTNAV